MKLDYVAIGKRIKMLREGRKLTQKYLADKLGLSSGSSITMLENGTNFTTVERLAIISEELKTSVDYILFGRSSNANGIYLAEDENQLLENYRKLDDDGRATLLGKSFLLATLSKTQNKKLG